MNTENLIKEELCPACRGKRLNEEVLNCKIKGYSIADMCEMKFVELLRVLKTVDDKRTLTIVQSTCSGLERMIIKLRYKGNTVLVVEHDKDVISIADEIIDVGPCAGKEGGKIVFQGTPKEMLEKSNTITAKCLRKEIAG